MPEQGRQTVFISHANPADNDVARWLAAKLSALGYSVWVDVEKLRGAESIWRTVEPVLRNEARCMILVLSRATFGADGLLRKGVANEMELALTLENEHPRFVLPWIVDDSPFSALPMQLQNRMSISEQRWSVAIGMILDYLGSLGVASSPSSQSSAALLQRLLISEHIGVTSKSATYDLNRIECISLPERIFSVEDEHSTDESYTTSNSFNGRRLSFHAIEGSSQLFGKGIPKALDLDDALRNGISSLRLAPRDVSNIIVELTRKELSSHLRAKGLIEQGRLNRNSVFFFNKSTVPNAKVNVKLPEKTRRSTRNVWGVYKDINWHLGIELHVSNPARIVVTFSPHVVFTRDGLRQPLDEDPIHDRKKQHSRRRAIAKLWFNDKWRGFFYPFLAHVRETDGTIRINFEGNSPLVLAGALSTIMVPATHIAVKELLPDDLVEPLDSELDDD